MKFRNATTNKVIPNVISYVGNIVQKDPSVRIYIGSDSQNHSRKTRVTTVIALRYSFGRGVHVLYNTKEIKPKIKKIEQRLTKEIEETITIAIWFSENSIFNIEALEFDINQDSKFKSNIVYQMAMGWAKGMGYKYLTKPDEMCATKAANILCR